MSDLFTWLQKSGDSLLAVGVFAVLGIMLVPLPPVLLDMLLAASISMAILLFLGAMYAGKPVEFSVFPTMLLVATVFRLALNVASTRLILLNGSEGNGAAGRIIDTFGQFVVGGNVVVGGILFVILVLINFIVITKGSGRIAEVAARFTLDALPGKQMAVDGELNAGLIDEKTAKARRAEITREADFYGAMDGASKFIRGDAIAGIVITLINCFGGAFIGAFQNGMPLIEATQTYVTLTIGDGLAGQVPALIVSTAAGLLVTRVQDDGDRPLAGQVNTQLLRNPKVMSIGALLLGCIALIPGLRLPFFVASAVVGGWAYRVWRTPKKSTSVDKAAPAKRKDATPEDLLPIEPLVIEVAADLVYLVDAKQGGELLQRIHKVRNQFAKDHGLVLPPVHLRDNMDLQNGEYAVLLRGETVGQGKLQPRAHLALDPGSAEGELEGVPTEDPVFGLPAYWILDRTLLQAQAQGFTVVDTPTVLTTHLVELMSTYGHELYDAKQLDDALERVHNMAPKLVEDLVPDPLGRASVLRVFRNLLREGLSIRDTQGILEVLAEYAKRTQDPDVLTEFVRQRMARHITGRFGDAGTIHAVRLSPDAENAVLRGLQSNDGAAPTLQLEPTQARALILGVRDKVEHYVGPGQAVVLCPPLARGAVRRLLERAVPRVTVLSSAELLPDVTLDPIGEIRLEAS